MYSAAWLASLTPQTASKHCWFGCRCGARGGRKVSSLVGEGVWASPSQLPSVTFHFWKHLKIFFPGVSLSQGLTWSDTAELEIRRDHSLEPVVQLQAVAGSVVQPGTRETFSFLPCFFTLPFQHAKHCCGREKTRSAGLQWYLHFNYLNTTKRCSTTISQGSFPRSLFLSKGASYSSSLSPNEKNNHHIHIAPSFSSFPDHFIKCEQNHL